MLRVLRHRFTAFFSVSASIAAISFACATPAPPPPEADLVFYGEHIYTVDPGLSGASGVAIRGSEIVAVGSRSEVEEYVGEATRVVELGSRALVPGFVAAHGHFSLVLQLLPLLNASSPPVGPMESIDDIVTALRARIEEEQIPPGEIVMGYGYDDSLLAENRHPDRDDLDRASSEHPIMLLHVSAHLMTGNSLALERAGLDAQSEDPAGGLIRRRPGTREPNGVLEETATYPFRKLLEKVATTIPPEARMQAIHETVAYHASYGVTTIQDGAVTPELVEGMRAAAAARPLALDVALFPVFHPEQPGSGVAGVGYTREYENGVRVAGVKFVLDGSPQGRTAWLSQPYTEGPPGAPADYVAYPMTPPAYYKEHVAKLIAAGIPVLAHANGDAAIDLMIEGVDEALAGQQKDHRTVTIHAQLAREDQLDEMKRLGIVPSFFAAHPYFWGDWHRVSFGDDRAMRISPMRSARDRDLAFTIHNDAPVVPPDVMRLIEVAMGRKTRNGVVLGADQTLDFDEALYAVTLGSAYQYFEEDRKGSITPGKRADLVVLGSDPKAVALDEISEIPIVETIAGGKTVYVAP